VGDSDLSLVTRHSQTCHLQLATCKPATRPSAVPHSAFVTPAPLGPLEQVDIGGHQALLPFYHRELYEIAFLQTIEFAQLRAMGKDLGSLLTDNEAILLARIIPLDHPPLARRRWRQDLTPRATSGDAPSDLGALMLLFHCPQKGDATPFTDQRFVAQPFFFANAIGHTVSFS
jgi:hypothetical protein